MLVKNPTHYFNDYTRIYNVVPDTDSFAYQSDKRLSYYQRLYFELLYTQKVNGSAFFYTLTYCDAKVPKFLNRNVHSYADIRKLVNGSISKVLLRKYGSRLRYFCACECGEGEGLRGIGNNPHYHFIFFVQPHPSLFGYYKKISVKEFSRLLRGFWLGKEEGYINYKDAAYGIVKEGSLGAEIINPAAFGYVIKYVIKDSVALKTDSIVYKHYYNMALEGLSQSRMSFYNYYLHLTQNYGYRRDMFWKKFQLSDYVFQRRCHITSLSLFDWFDKVGTEYTKSEVKKYYDWFEKVYAPSFAKMRLAEFNNLYGPKVRLSNGLGEYGLRFVCNKEFQPRFHLSYCGTQCSQPLALYYIRKLYYNVYKCPYTGNPVYRLNQLGLTLRVNQFREQYLNTLNNVKESVSYVCLNDVVVPTHFDNVLFARYLDGEVSLSDIVSYHKDYISSFLHVSDFDKILELYTVYKLVYQYRTYYPDKSIICLKSDFDLSDVETDLTNFLSHSLSFLNYETCDIFGLFDKHPDMLSFSSYPVFSSYIEYFDFLDSLCDVVSAIRDREKKALFAQKGEHSKKIHSYAYSSQCPF